MTSDPRTVPAALDRFARQLPDHPALITDERTFTAAALREEVDRATAALFGVGVEAGGRVAFWSPI
ncbi:MAG: fatty acid--CoA ligase, partial [Mycobacterium sp.]|nr:fatty acid--CoA ligase [Mycobacterium sp.]